MARAPKFFVMFRIVSQPPLKNMKGLIVQVKQMLNQGQRQELERVHEVLCEKSKIYLEAEGHAFGAPGFKRLTKAYAEWKHELLASGDSGQEILRQFGRPVTTWATGFGTARPIMVLSGQLAESLFNRKHKEHVGIIRRIQDPNKTILEFGTRSAVGLFHAKKARRKRNVLLPLFFGTKQNKQLVQVVEDTISRSFTTRMKGMISKIGGK